MRLLYCLIIISISSFPLHLKGGNHNCRIDTVSIDSTDSISNNGSIEPKGLINTNLAEWCVGVMNIGGEVTISRKFTLNLSLSWSPWYITKKFAPRVFAILPEIRWWIKKPLAGYFFGVHFNMAWYNLKLGDYRYQDIGSPCLGGGITYGYNFNLSRHLGLELAVGAGYISFRYDKFHNSANGSKIDTRKTNYFGIDRINVSLTYYLPHR